MKCRYFVAFMTRSMSCGFMRNDIITIEVKNPDNLGYVALRLQEKLKRDWGQRFSTALVNFWRL